MKNILNCRLIAPINHFLIIEEGKNIFLKQTIDSNISRV
jgi:hypothetical protein